MVWRSRVHQVAAPGGLSLMVAIVGVIAWLLSHLQYVQWLVEHERHVQSESFLCEYLGFWRCLRS